MITKQCRRLNCITNALARSLPLKLLTNGRLKRLVAAYGSVYILGVLDSYWDYEKRNLIKAHSNFTGVVSQYYYRATDKWNKAEGLFDNTNRSIYGRLNLDKFEDIIPKFQKSFNARYAEYESQIYNECE